MSYQSPIDLSHCDIYSIDQHVKLNGKNKHVVYNYHKKIFEVKDEIILKVNGKKYQMEEYHFHCRSEHKLNDKFYDGEVHYVFIEIGSEKLKGNHKCCDICGSAGSGTSNSILVIGAVIKHKEHKEHKELLTRYNIKVPSQYFIYDGSLTTGNYAPVRWYFSRKHILSNIDEIKKIAKTARKLTSFDGIIVLFNC